MSSGARVHIIVMLPGNISVDSKFALSCRQHLTQPKTSFPKSEVNPLLQPFGRGRGLCLLHPLCPHLLPLSLLPSFRMGYFHSPLHLLVLQDAAPARSPHSGLSGSKVRTTSSREFTQPRLPKSTRLLEARGRPCMAETIPFLPSCPTMTMSQQWRSRRRRRRRLRRTRREIMRER